jgi:peptide/nickel transport system substrate-binding protein
MLTMFDRRSDFLRRSIFFILTAIVAVGIYSCQGGLANFLSATATATNNRLVFAILSDPKTFNAALSNESPNVFGYVTSGLISEDGGGNIVGDLAEKWDVSPDRLRITFNLRPNLKWSDGKPLTTDDILFSFNEVYFNPEIDTSTRDVLKIGKSRRLPTLRKIDDRRIEFTTPEPFAPFLRTLGGVSILPAHKLRESIKTKGNDGKLKFMSMWGINTPPKEIVGSGLFVIKSYTPGERIVFARNPHYWRKDASGRQQPYIEEVVWQIVESTDTSIIQFRSGQLDSIGVSPDSFGLLKREEKRSGFKIYQGGPSSGTNFISFNLSKVRRDGKPVVNPIKSKWFDNVKFRQAVAYALDRERMLKNIYRGIGELQNSPISVPSPYYLPTSKGLKAYNYDVEKAKKLFLEAGFKYANNNQLTDADNNPVRFTLITNSGNKIREAMGVQVKQDLAAIGIQVDFNPIAFPLLVSKLDETLDWDCCLLGFTGGAEPNEGANLWLVDGSLHMFNQNPKVKEGTTDPQKPDKPRVKYEGWQASDWENKISDLYIQAAQELNEDSRKKIYAEVQQLTQENLPKIYLINSLSMSAVRDRVKNIKYSALNGAFWNMYEIYIKK